MITTQTELDALPDGTVILQGFGIPLVKREGAWETLNGFEGVSEPLPAVVLEMPGAELDQLVGATEVLATLDRRIRQGLLVPEPEANISMNTYEGLHAAPVTDITMDAYQKQAAQTAIYPDHAALDYLIPGLAAEAGEVAGKWAKHMRDVNALVPDDALMQALATEAGDVLWMVAMLCKELGYSLGEVAEANLYKLASRQQRGTLEGSGDDR